MNNYVIEFKYADSNVISTITVRAWCFVAAKHTARDIIRKHGYKAYMKDMRLLYIDNERKAVNEK